MDSITQTIPPTRSLHLGDPPLFAQGVAYRLSEPRLP